MHYVRCFDCLVVAWFSFSFLSFSSIFSGLKDCCFLVQFPTGHLMCPTFLSCREKLNSMNLLLYMSPIAVVVLLPVALIMEPSVFEFTLSLGRKDKFMWLLLLLNSTLAYSANLTNFLVTKHTSALTLQVWHCLPFSLFFSDYLYELEGFSCCRKMKMLNINSCEMFLTMTLLSSLCQSYIEFMWL